ncbi:sodium:calcium antiporter [Candidatus Bathyarchaeota archaeon]|nr:sodium:calcium antiporter [Candidatus Bathyarchaeota archaeon]MBS7636288.1 sodium:calcium antiporter [Candidatus Bathyarchaeota archaeon]
MIEIIIQALMLFASLAVLATASFFAIKYIEDFMEITRLSEVATGFVILAIMTCMPEITVAVFSVQHGTAGISIGTVLGSHLFNIGIVVGLLAAFGSLRKCGTEALVELTDLLFLASIIPLLLVAFKAASPIVGILLITVFALSFYRMSKKRHPPTFDYIKEGHVERKKPIIILATILVAVVFVVLSARTAILSATEIIKLVGISQSEIGAKIFAVGTSLPEFAFGLVALKRGRVHLALGDAVGANLTTITLVLGLVLLFAPSAIEQMMFTEILIFVLIMNIILWRYLTKGGVTQFGGIILITVYIVFQAIF